MTLPIKITLLVGYFILSNGIAFAKESKQDVYLTDWISSCTSKTLNSSKVCVIERNVFFDKNMSRRMLSFSVRTSQGEAPVLTIISPLGALISEGLELDSGDLPFPKLPFIFCDQFGCVSQTKLTSEQLNLIMSKKSLLMKYQLLNSNKAVVNFDLNGFDSAYSKIKQ